MIVHKLHMCKTAVRNFSCCQNVLRSGKDVSPYETPRKISKEKVDVQRKHESSRIGIIGVPFHKGQSSSGVEEAPTALREYGIVKQMISSGHNVKDFGDILCESKGERNDVPDKIRSLPDLACASHALSSKVQEVMKENRKVLTIGGDHSIALGSVDGHIQAKNGEICLLWVDAHADLNTADTSDTGHMHGMPVSLLVKELADYWPYLPGLDWQKPTMSIKNIAYIGLRSVDQYERLIIEKYGVGAYGMEDIEKYGIHAVTTLALERINPTGSKSLHVSFDIDSLDTLEAPSTGTSVRGGLTLREGVHIMEIAHRTGWLGAVDLVEINPRLGNELQVQTTLEAATHVIKAAFGFSRTGNVPPHVESLPGYYAPFIVDVKEKQAEVCNILAVTEVSAGEQQMVKVCSGSLAAQKALGRAHIGSPLVLECWNAIPGLVQRKEVERTWVPGHSGITGNELADAAARSGADPLHGP